MIFQAPRYQPRPRIHCRVLFIQISRLITADCLDLDVPSPRQRDTPPAFKRESAVWDNTMKEFKPATLTQPTKPLRKYNSLHFDY